MFTIRTFLKQEPVLIAAAAAAAISCLLVTPDAEYLHYIDWRTLALLYCLMVVVSGLRKAGLFAFMAHGLCEKAGSVRSLGAILVSLSFFTAMLITNDVALLTFVPFSIVVLGMAGHREAVIKVVVLQTAAANLGSMLTPMGNPQNLYLYTFYDYSFGGFLSETAPIWFLSLLLIGLLCLWLPRAQIRPELGEAPGLDKHRFILYSALFLVCLLTVLRLLPWSVMLGIVIVVLFWQDRGTLKNADFMLLLTFLAFFLFSGNLARMESVDSLLRKAMHGRELYAAILSSQVISNVPAALLLSGFTSQAGALLLGVNIGGLGTPIASLASLISLKLYSHSSNAETGKYLLLFSVVNLLLLAALTLSAMVLL